MLTRSHFFCFVLLSQFSHYEGKARPSSDEGWRPCVSWYHFQMLARLGGARAVEQGLGLVVFSSRCDASCWFLHMFCWPYPNMACRGQHRAAPLLTLLFSPPTVALLGPSHGGRHQDICPCLSPASPCRLPVQRRKDLYYDLESRKFTNNFIFSCVPNPAIYSFTTDRNWGNNDYDA